jgi:hypothetical protein
MLMASTFQEFVDKKTRQSKKRLQIVEKILKSQGMAVNNFLSEDDPYIFLRSSTGSLPFDGLRIYRIGDSIAYRVQKEDKTHPYGKAYLLDVEGMYEDLISDNVDEEKAGKTVIKSVAEEMRNFFSKSAEADKEVRAAELDQQTDPMGSVALSSSTGTDYSNTLQQTPRTYSPL